MSKKIRNPWPGPDPEMISKNFRKNIKIVSVSGGVILLITGILILTNKLQALGYFILETIPILGNLG